MDIAALKRKAEAAREFQEQVDGMSFTLRLPTRHEFEVEAARARAYVGGGVDPAAFVKLKRSLLVRGLVSWAGVTVDSLDPGAGADEVELAEGAADLLFEARGDIEEALWTRFIVERAKREKKQDDAEKN